MAAIGHLGYLLGAYDAMCASRHKERRLWLAGLLIINTPARQRAQIGGAVTKL